MGRALPLFRGAPNADGARPVKSAPRLVVSLFESRPVAGSIAHDHHQTARAAVLDAVHVFLRRIDTKAGLPLRRVAETGPDGLVLILKIHRHRGDAVPAGSQPWHVVGPVVVIGNRLP